MVFQDPSGVRWRVVRVVATVVVVLGLLLVADILAGILTAPSLPQMEASIFGTHEASSTFLTDTYPHIPLQPNVARSKQTPASLFRKPFVRTAFVVQDDPRRVADLCAHVGHLAA